MAVIIFVVLAIAKGLCSFLPHKTRPVSASSKTAPSAFTEGISMVAAKTEVDKVVHIVKNIKNGVKKNFIIIMPPCCDYYVVCAIFAVSCKNQKIPLANHPGDVV